MRTTLLRLLDDAWRALRRIVANRRTAEARARFWSEVRKGEVEAEKGAAYADEERDSSRTTSP